MANRRFRSEYLFQHEAMVCQVYARLTFGSAGSVTLDAANSKGVASVVLGTTGKYTITLQDNYNKLLELNAINLVASGLPAASTVALVTNSVTSATAPSVVIQYSQAGVATNPASGEAAFISITLGNSSV